MLFYDISKQEKRSLQCSQVFQLIHNQYANINFPTALSTYSSYSANSSSFINMLTQNEFSFTIFKHLVKSVQSLHSNAQSGCSEDLLLIQQKLNNLEYISHYSSSNDLIQDNGYDKLEISEIAELQNE
ncbi:Hypothetical_protein [Hexamita inflata]|uniref:Hypothetical_protein n=1 Tax=Hexamita inflata TaxID=28002 RepID=A0AA86NBY5_9EUKA|nr:Hypothetical protein HINF_LOCUS4494 [Hexamita inflata]